MRTCLVASVLVIAVQAACKPAADEEKERDEKTAPTPTPTRDAGPPPPAPPPSASAPAGKIRLAAVPGPVAIRFVVDGAVVARVEGRPVTFGSSSDDAVADLARQLGLTVGRRGAITLMGPSGAVASASDAKARPPGVKVDFDASMAGDRLATILSEVSRTELEGRLGGSFAVRVKGVPANELLAVLAAMCGAELRLSKSASALARTKCEPSPPEQEVEGEPEPPRYDDIGGRIVGPQLEVATLRVTGLVTGTEQPRALLSDGGDDHVVVGQGDIIGTLVDRCARSPAQEAEADAIEAKIKEAAEQVRDLEKKTASAAADRASIEEIEALQAEARALRGQLDAVSKLSADDRPGGCAGRDGIKFRWQVDAIDARGVRLKPSAGHPGEDDPAPIRLDLAEAPG